MTKNYERYLVRMTESCEKSTKGLLPDLIEEFSAKNGIETPKILEVGFGSGVIGAKIKECIPDAILVGIDMNEDNVRSAQEGDVYSEAYCCRFEDFEALSESFDVVLFASVLHEIGSYADVGAYTKKPVEDAINQAKTLLKHNGFIVIRDGIADEKSKRNSYNEYNLPEKTMEAFKRFQKEFCGYTDEFATETECTFISCLDNTPSCVVCPEWMMKEFLCTYTWGLESWPREIHERFCYLSKSEYIEMLSDMEIAKEIYSVEEYPQYFAKIINNYSCSDVLAVFVAVKK